MINLPDHRLHRAGQNNSAKALAKTGNARGSLNTRVYDAIAYLTKLGMDAIPEDIATHLAIDLIDARRAFHVLKNKGLIVETKDRPNPKGNDCMAWVVVL